MIRQPSRLLALAPFALLFLGASTPAPMPPIAVSFSGWKGIAESPVPNRLGPKFFRLRASVTWTPGAPADPNRYRVAIDSPSGRDSQTFPLAPGDQPGSTNLGVWVPLDAVIDLPAAKVALAVRVIDAETGRTVSNGSIAATIDQFPNPGDLVPPSPTAFGWGSPLKPVDGGAQLLTRKPGPIGETDLNEGPQGLQFARVFRSGDHPGFFVSTAEATLDQVSSLTKAKGYNPNLRPGEFTFTTDSPAIGVSPAVASAYLEALGGLDSLKLTYRLPSKPEWVRFAKAGQSTRFWWGDDPDDDLARLGANFKGLERPKVGSTREDEADVIRPTATGGVSLGGFKPSPWGLWHTFGNVAEWATDPDGGPPWLMGGTFRTDRDKANFRPEDLEIQIKAPDAYDAEANPFAGIRPVVEISAEQGSIAATKLLGLSPFRDVKVDFDPDTATATLTGVVDTPLLRQRADEALRPLWFLAAVDNQLTVRNSPVPIDRVVSISGQGDSARVSLAYLLDNRIYRVPVAISWAEKLPVEGSTAWINVFRPDGSPISASRINPVELGRSTELKVVIDGAKMASAKLAIDAPVRIAISLGKDAAVSTNDPSIASEVVPLSWRLDPERLTVTRGNGRVVRRAP